MLKIGIDGYKDDDLANEFLTLKRAYVETNAKTSAYDDDSIDEDSELFKSNKNKKGKKKKKKKSRFVDDRLDMLLGSEEDGDLESDFLTGDDIVAMKKPKKGKKTVFDTKQAKKSRKKNIERKFAREIAGLRKVLADVEMTAADAREIFSTIKNSKSRYVGKTLVDLIAAINQSNSSRASILKEIANINKSIVDLQLKEAKDRKDDSKEDKDAERHGIDFFSKFFNSGDRNAIKDMAREYYSAEGDLDNVSIAEEDDFISKRLDEEENKYRTEEGNAYIRYESMKPEDVIFYHRDGSWETGAIDGEGDMMPDDYPVIPKENLGKVRFMLDDLKAIDETARTWRVIEVD